MFYIQEKTYNKIISWAQLAYDKDKNEISGLLVLKEDDKGDWELIEPDILKQKNTATLTVLDKDAITDWVMKKGMKHGSNIRYCWWHSHHMMSAEWSGTDDKEIEAWNQSDWSVALLVNLKDDYKLRVSYWDPIEMHEDVELEIIRPVMPSYTKAMEKKYEELCEDDSKTGWNFSKKDDKQISLYSGYNGWTPAQQKMLKLAEHVESKDEDQFDACIEKVEALRQQFCDGEINTQSYHKLIDKVNKKLKKANVKWSIKTLPSLSDTQNLQHICTTEAIVEFEFKDNKVKEWAGEYFKQLYQYIHDNDYYGGWV